MLLVMLLIVESQTVTKCFETKIPNYAKMIHLYADV